MTRGEVVVVPTRLRRLPARACLAAAVLALLTALTPTVGADHCNDLAMFGHVMPLQPAAVNTGAISCDVSGGHAVNGFVLPPGTFEVVVRYAPPSDRDPGSGVAAISGTISGLGAGGGITLKRSSEGFNFVYDSDPVPIDRLARGAITAVVHAPAGAQGVSYRTAA